MNPWHSLAGKTIWVTGGAGYLGSAIIEELESLGVKALCLDLPGKAEAFVQKRGFKHIVPVTLDLSDADRLPPAVDSLVAAHGVPDGVIHMSFASSAGKRLEELTKAEFQKTFDDALPSTFVFCRALAEKMKPRGGGSIVIYSSMYGVVAPDVRIYHPPMTPNPIDYGASKAALLQLSRYLAVHYGHDKIRFNCLTPGPFPNPAVQQSNPEFLTRLSAKTALGRVGSNQEIVGPSLFLLSDSASFVTGHNLVVDGGWTAW